ncbi:uncharacterized protein LOC143294298 [Babylonia areolata]|uniref:uncharacterized protein LOC143294298 n=1 Tax=Babylonia areolata TaxID=304850 RepID=UPI003FD614A8
MKQKEMRASWSQQCLRSHAQRVGAKLRPLVMSARWLRPLVHALLSPARWRWWTWMRVRVSPLLHRVRASRRRTVSVAAVAVVMTTVLTYQTLWQYPASSPTRKPCPLPCLYGPSPYEDLAWSPLPVPMEHALSDQHSPARALPGRRQ